MDLAASCSPPVPPHLLPSLLAKLSGDILDAGSFLSFAPRPPDSPLLPRSRYTLHACVPLSPAEHVFLVDQHFQFSFSELPRILKAYPGLAEQLGEALEEAVSSCDACTPSVTSVPVVGWFIVGFSSSLLPSGVEVGEEQAEEVDDEADSVVAGAPLAFGLPRKKVRPSVKRWPR